MFSKVKNYFLKLICPKPKKGPLLFQSILIASTTGLGDTIWALPAIRALKHAHPNSKIYVLTTSMGETLFKNNPDIENTFCYESLWKTYKKLRKHFFDTIFIFHVSQRAIFPLLSKLKPISLIGTRGKNKGLDFLFSHLAKDRFCHEVVRRLDQLREVQVPVFWSAPKIYISSKPPGTSFLIHPGAKDSYKCWPMDYWADLAFDLTEKKSLKVFITGTKEETSLIKNIHKKAPKLMIRQNLSLAEFMELILQQKAIITNDTGPMHLASALQIPVIALFAATDPHLCGPFLAKEAYLLARGRTCTPCLKRHCQSPFCMKQISKDDVLGVVDKLCK